MKSLTYRLLTPNPRLTYGKGAGRPESTLVRYRRRPTPLGLPTRDAELVATAMS